MPATRTALEARVPADSRQRYATSYTSKNTVSFSP